MASKALLPKPVKGGKGFTLLELVIALAVISIVGGGLFLTFRPSPHRDLEIAIYQLQADIRYIQRRAITEGHVFEIEFNMAHNRYRIFSVSPGGGWLRSVYFQNDVRITALHSRGSNVHVLGFLPRGTVGGVRGRDHATIGPTTIRLSDGRHTMYIAITPTSGRTRIGEI